MVSGLVPNFHVGSAGVCGLGSAGASEVFEVP